MEIMLGFLFKIPLGKVHAEQLSTCLISFLELILCTSLVWVAIPTFQFKLDYISAERLYSIQFGLQIVTISIVF